MKIDDLALMQNPDGGFGRFHSMSSDSSITTEKALRRFLFLNLDKDYPIVKKSIDYLKKCLNKDITVPDRREKVINWDVFEELMFSAWLNIFKVNDEKVTSTQSTWKSVINSIIDNKFNINEYITQYRSMFGKKGLREICPSSFYMVCLLTGKLTQNAKQAYFEYIMEQGIYYIYDKNLFKVPTIFDSKNTIYYLFAIRLISPYVSSKDELNFVKTWIYNNISLGDYWDMPNLKPDGIVFPRADNWRKYENKLEDINNYISEILIEL